MEKSFRGRQGLHEWDIDDINHDLPSCRCEGYYLHRILQNAFTIEQIQFHHFHIISWGAYIHKKSYIWTFSTTQIKCNKQLWYYRNQRIDQLLRYLRPDISAIYQKCFFMNCYHIKKFILYLNLKRCFHIANQYLQKHLRTRKT